MKKIILIAFLFIVKTGMAQDNSTNDISSSVVVHKDPRLDLLVKKQSTVNATVKKASGYTTQGYRILVINTNNREEAIAAKTKIYTYFPELKAYLLYQSPFFKLKTGNFKGREEAEKYRKNMNKLFPKGVFIINDTIEIKPEKDDSDDQK